MKAVVLSGMDAHVLSRIDARAIRNRPRCKQLFGATNSVPSNSSTNNRSSNVDRSVRRAVDNEPGIGLAILALPDRDPEGAFA